MTIGMVTIAELAQRFSLSADSIKTHLIMRITQQQEGAKLEGSFLSSSQHTARLRAAVRGAMRGVTVPTSLSSLSSRWIR